MKIDLLKTIFTNVVVIMTLIGGFYAIVLAEFVLDDLSKGALIGFMGMALNHAFGSEVAKQTSNATTAALMTPAPEQTTTVSAGPPMTITTSPNPPEANP